MLQELYDESRHIDGTEDEHRKYKRGAGYGAGTRTFIKHVQNKLAAAHTKMEIISLCMLNITDEDRRTNIRLGQGEDKSHINKQ